MNKRRHWIFVLLCIPFLHTIILTIFVLKDFQNAAKQTVSCQDRMHSAKHRIDYNDLALTFNRTKTTKIIDISKNRTANIRKYPTAALNRPVQKYPTAAFNRPKATKGIDISKNRTAIIRKYPTAAFNRPKTIAGIDISKKRTAIIRKYPTAAFNRPKIAKGIDISKNRTAVIRKYPTAAFDQPKTTKGIDISKNRTAVIRKYPTAALNRPKTAKEIGISKNRTAIIRKYPTAAFNRPNDSSKSRTAIIRKYPTAAFNRPKTTKGIDSSKNRTAIIRKYPTAAINRPKINKEIDISKNRTTVIWKYPNFECFRRKLGNIHLSLKDLPLTALASPHRSGNTWVRHLLQLATGIGTSALYCDAELRSKGFPFECDHVNYRRMLVVKTHEPRPPQPPKIVAVMTKNGVRRGVFQQPQIKSPPFQRAVVLIRDPYNFLVANMYTSHLDAVKEEEYFGESKWRRALPGLLQWWINFNDYWLKIFKGQVYPLLYSKLLTDTETELRKLLNFLNATYTDSDIKCALDFKEGNFHRNEFVWTRIHDNTELFNNIMKTKIDASVKDLSQHLSSKYGIVWLNEMHKVRFSRTQHNNLDLTPSPIVPTWRKKTQGSNGKN